MQRSLWLLILLGLAACAGAPAQDELAPTDARSTAESVQEPLTTSLLEPATDPPPSFSSWRASAGLPPPQRGARLPYLRISGETSLRELMRGLAAQSGVDIVVDAEAEDAVRDAGIVFDVEIERPIGLGSALELLAELSGDAFAWIRRHGVLLVTTPEKARPPSVTYVYDISDLLRGVAGYPGPEMGDLRGRADLPDEELHEPLVDEDTLLDLIRNSVAPGTWDDGDVSLRIENGKLFVRHW